jgi:hypothetical protein
MSWSVLQSNGSFSDTWATSTALSYTANASSGSKLVAYTMVFGSVTVTAVEDAALNAMTKLASAAPAGSATNGEFAIWAMDTPAGDAGIKPALLPVFSTGTTSALSMVIEEVAGLLPGNTSAMLDGTIVSSNGTISANGSVACGAYSSAAAGEFLVAAAADDESSAIATYGIPTGSTTYTRDAHAQNATNSTDNVPAYGSSAGGAETASFGVTLSGTNVHWVTLFGAFKLGSSTTPVSSADSASGADAGPGPGPTPEIRGFPSTARQWISI